jgi:hypothetical protein
MDKPIFISGIFVMVISVVGIAGGIVMGCQGEWRGWVMLVLCAIALYSGSEVTKLGYYWDRK